MNDIGVLPISNTGKFFLVDACLMADFSTNKWRLNRGGYVNRVTSRRGQTVQFHVHKIVCDSPAGMDTDHINGFKIDNRSCNLRACTRSQNVVNTTKRKPLKHRSNVRRSKSKGVDWFEKRKKWRARITCDGQVHCLGYHALEIDAATAYNVAAEKLFGRFAKLNEP